MLFPFLSRKRHEGFVADCLAVYHLIIKYGSRMWSLETFTEKWQIIDQGIFRLSLWPDRDRFFQNNTLYLVKSRRSKALQLT